MNRSFILRWRVVVCSVLICGAILCTAAPLDAQAIPKITIGIDRAEKPQEVALTLQILFMMTILSLAPALLIMMTSFTRIIVIFHFLRQALGTQQMPPNQMLIGLALFLTFFVMAPVWSEVNDKALQPYLNGELAQKAALDEGVRPIREFMMAQTREKDLGLFMKISRLDKPQCPYNIPTHVLIPAFIISELRTAFQIGFLLFIPLIIIDMVVASVLMSMGMMMLPPVMISLPFKILLFVLVDGWNLVIGSIITGFR